MDWSSIGATLLTVAAYAAALLTLVGVLAFLYKLLDWFHGGELKREKQKRLALESARQSSELVSSSNTAGSNALQSILNSKLLRVGCLWYPPFVEYSLNKGKIEATGYYPDVLITLASRNDMQVVFSVLGWHEAIDALESGTVDVVACVLKSADRREKCNFVATVFRVGVGAVVQQGQEKITRHGDLASDDVSIAVTKGEIGWTYSRESLSLHSRPAKFTVFEDTSIQTMMSLVAGGTVDCALADSLSCAQYVEQSNMDGPPLLEDAFSGRAIHVEDNSLMIAKHNPEFANWLESGIRSIRTEREFVIRENEIESKYSSIIERAGPKPPDPK